MILQKRIYVINKPRGWTSFDVVNKLKHVSGEKKIGHAGTLDPLATGVLVVGVGREFTKTLGYLSNMDKVYYAEIIFGLTTDSYDLDGRVQTCTPVEGLTQEQVETAMEAYVGEIQQMPPIYSAIKVKGKKLYEYARKDQVVEIQPRQVTIYSLKLLRFYPGQHPRAIIEANVSKGTYIRSLAYDLGQQLGVGAVLGDLVRFSVGEYKLSEAREIHDFT